MINPQDPAREQLSALIDGELGADESRFLFRRLENDAELTATFSRYHLIRTCIKREAFLPLDDRVRAGVAASLAAEPAPMLRRTWARPMIGAAMAAGVAAIALMVIDRPLPMAADPVASSPAPPTLAEPTALRTRDFSPPMAMRQVSDQWAVPLAVSALPTRVLATGADARIEGYFLGHSVGAEVSARAGYVPYAHLIAWPNAQVTPAAEAATAPP